MCYHLLSCQWGAGFSDLWIIGSQNYNTCPFLQYGLHSRLSENDPLEHSCIHCPEFLLPSAQKIDYWKTYLLWALRSDVKHTRKCTLLLKSPPSPPVTVPTTRTIYSILAGNFLLQHSPVVERDTLPVEAVPCCDCATQADPGWEDIPSSSVLLPPPTLKSGSATQILVFFHWSFSIRICKAGFSITNLSILQQQTCSFHEAHWKSLSSLGWTAGCVFQQGHQKSSQMSEKQKTQHLFHSL